MCFAEYQASEYSFRKDILMNCLKALNPITKEECNIINPLSYELGVWDIN